MARVFDELSIFTNVVLAIEARKSAAGETLGRWWDWRPSADTRDEAGKTLASVGLEARTDEVAGQLSHGDKKRLEFAITLAGKPRILMLDEPTAGMSPSARREMKQLLARLKADTGVTIVMTEHDMDIIFELADRLMVLNYGEVIAIGNPQDVRDDPTVRRVYLGREHSNA